MKRVLLAALLFIVAIYATPASAIKSREVMEKMSEDERFGYLTGLVNMLSYQYVLAGDRPRAVCISKEFSKKKETWARLYDAMKQLPDKAPEGIIVVMMKKACGG